MVGQHHIIYLELSYFDFKIYKLKTNLSEEKQNDKNKMGS